MTVTTREELLESYATGVRDFAHAELHGDDLWGSELQGAQLEGADLGEADLRRADLARASLRGADLSHALLTGASLRGADLRDANLSGAILYGVDLTHARLEGADLEGARLYDAELGRRRRVEQQDLHLARRQPRGRGGRTRRSMAGDAQDDLHRRAVEPSLPDLGSKVRGGLLRRPGRAVRAILLQGVIHVGCGEVPAEQRDLGTADRAVIAGAVEPLVMRPREAPDGCKRT